MQHLFRRILHGTDFSKESRKAFEMALALARSAATRTGYVPDRALAAYLE